MKKLRAAVVGCGAIAHNCHIPGYQKSKYSEVVAVADPNIKNRESAIAQFNIPNGYKNIDDLLANEQVDVVSVCPPNAYHAENVIKALRGGCHVLCEKPLCLTLKEAAAIEKELQRTDKKFMVAFTHRFFTGIQKTKQWIDQGKIGQPYMIRIRFAHQGPMDGWAMTNSFYRPDQAGGGALFDMGIHAIDTAMHFMGPIERVNAMTTTLEKKIEMEDNAVLQFGFASGSLGYAEVGWTSKQGFFGIEVFGSEAAIVLDYLGGVFFIQGQTTAAGKRSVKKKMIVANPMEGGWPAQMEYFINTLRKGQTPCVGYQEGLMALKVALGAYESANKGRMVTVR